MNLDLSDDQQMLKDSLDRVIADRDGQADRRVSIGLPGGWSRAMWARITALGLTMLPFAEEDGGLGLGPIETMIVGETFGRGLVVEPYLASIILAGTALARFASSDQRAQWLAPVLAGSEIAAYAHQAAVTATRDGTGWRLSGTATVMLAGDIATILIFPTDLGLFVVPGDAAGVTRRGYRLHGGGNAADIILDKVRASSAQRLDGNGRIDTIIEAGIAFIAAEASGIMQAALDTTVDYLKTREQFGRPIGANQALAHRAAEMLVEVEQARSAALYAAILAQASDADERAAGFAAVKAVIGKAARFVGQQTVQLHGGIGVSEEHIASHYFRRLTAIDLLFGGTDEHVDRLAMLGGFTGLEHRQGERT